MKLWIQLPLSERHSSHAGRVQRRLQQCGPVLHGSTVWPRGEEAALKTLGGQALAWGRRPLGAGEAGAGPQRSHWVVSCHPGEDLPAVSLVGRSGETFPMCGIYQG